MRFLERWRVPHNALLTQPAGPVPGPIHRRLARFATARFIVGNVAVAVLMLTPWHGIGWLFRVLAVNVLCFAVAVFALAPTNRVLAYRNGWLDSRLDPLIRDLTQPGADDCDQHD